MLEYKPPDYDWFVKNELVPPTSTTHGGEEDIRAKLKPMLPTKWRQEGDMLIAETENGIHAQKIPTNKLLTGTDKDGMPVFAEIKLT